ncbi:MAG TPA: hypothetical protein DDY24_09120, partial [Alcaligenaceae bacterium]|nr:hypothetical protein [Alcaligenaceae bacterium]
MADANTSSSQQSQDAQTLDNLTSLQQPNEAEQSSVTQNNAARIDSPVTTPNAPTQDSPSLYNDVTQTTDSFVEQTAVGSDSTIDSEGVVSTGNKSNPRVDTSGTEFVVTPLPVVGSEEIATAPSDMENLSVSASEASSINPSINSSSGRPGNATTAAAPENATEPATTNNEPVSPEAAAT